MSKETGGPAFCTLVEDGMTLRDYFAAKAMQGDWAAGEESAIISCNSRLEAAELYYQMADAMLAARAA